MISSEAPPQLRLARFEDYEDIRHLAAVHERRIPSFQQWRDLWIDNPVRSRLRQEPPIGWVLQAPSGQVVGTMGTVWSMYRCRGVDLVSAAGRFWFVTPPYRGYALRLMDEYFSQTGVDLFVNNTVAPAAIDSFSQLSDRLPVGDWQSASYWVTAPPCAQTLPRIPGSFTIESTEGFDYRFDIFWHELERQNRETLLAVRDSEALSWHFAAPLRSKHVWIFTASRNGRLCAYCIFTRQDHAFGLPAFPIDTSQRFRGMRLVDFQSIEPEIDLVAGLLAPALQRCTAEGFVLLENLGRGVPKMRVVDECAPYRKQLENWKFYYRAADPRLDVELREPARWDPSAYDGDASFE